jgi:hypothetical protein
MAHEMKGRILFADGRPAEGVRVRVLDRDAPGKEDDDLTVSEGLSNAEGHFVVQFAPSKYLDFREIEPRGPRNLPFDRTLETRVRRLPDLSDLYQPYVLFEYTFNGQARVHSAAWRPFKHEFRLPERTPMVFRPSEHGFRFINCFPGYFLPISVPAIPDIPSVRNYYGLCGGMAAAAYDFLLAERPVPPDDKAPPRAGPLHQYLYRRQIDSLGPLGAQVMCFFHWMALPDGTPHGTQRRTLDAFERIRAQLDDRNAVPIGLVYVRALDTLAIWKNHQVLAYGYEERPDGGLDVKIYDPNHPGQDDVVVRCERVEVGNGEPGETVMGLRGEQRVGGRKKKDVRGFFEMPYVALVPPAELGN